MILDVIYFDKTFISHRQVIMRPDIKKTDSTTLLTHYHYWVDGTERYVDYFATQNKQPIK